MAEENVERKLVNSYWNRESVIEWAREAGKTEVIRTPEDLKKAISRCRKKSPKHTPSYTTIRRLMGDEGLAPVLQAADELCPWDREHVLRELRTAGRNDIVRDENDLARVLAYSPALPTITQLKAIMGEDGLAPAMDAAQIDYYWNLDKVMELASGYRVQSREPITVQGFRRAVRSADPVKTELPTWQTINYVCNGKVDNLVQLVNELHTKPAETKTRDDSEVTEVYVKPLDQISQPTEPLYDSIAEQAAEQHAEADEDSVSPEEAAQLFEQKKQEFWEEIHNMRDKLGRPLESRDLVDADVTMSVVNHFYSGIFKNLSDVSSTVEAQRADNQGLYESKSTTLRLHTVAEPADLVAPNPHVETLPMEYVSSSEIESVVREATLAPETVRATEQQIAAEIDADSKTMPGVGATQPVYEPAADFRRREEDDTLVKPPVITAEAIGNEPDPSDNLSLEQVTAVALGIIDGADRVEATEAPDYGLPGADETPQDEDRQISEYAGLSDGLHEAKSKGSDVEVVNFSGLTDEFDHREPTNVDWMRAREKSALIRIARNPNVPAHDNGDVVDASGHYDGSRTGAPEPTDMPAAPTSISGGHYESVSGEIDFGGRLDVSDVEAGQQEDARRTEDSGRARLLSASTADSITSKLFEDGTSSAGAREVSNPLAEQQGSVKKTIPLAELQKQARERGIKTMDMFDRFAEEQVKANPAMPQVPDNRVIEPENGRNRVHTPSAYTPSGCGEVVGREGDTDPSIPAQKEAAESYDPVRASKRRTAVGIGVGIGLTATAFAAVFGLASMSGDRNPTHERMDENHPAAIAAVHSDAGSLEDAIMKSAASAPPLKEEAGMPLVAVTKPAPTYTPDNSTQSSAHKSTNDKGLAPNDPRHGCNLRLLMEFNSDDYSFESAKKNLTTYVVQQLNAGVDEFYVYGTASIEDAKDKWARGGPRKDNSAYNQRLSKQRALRTKADIESLARAKGRKINVHAVGVGEQDLWAIAGNALMPNRGTYISTVPIPVPGTDTTVDDALRTFTPHSQHGNACISEARSTQPVKQGALPSTGPGNRNQRGDDLDNGHDVDVSKVKELYFAYTESRVTWEELVKGSLEAGLREFSLIKAAELIDARSEYLAATGLKAYTEFEKELLSSLYFNHVYETELTDSMIERSCRVYGLPKMNRATVEGMYAQMTGSSVKEDGLDFEIDVDEVEFLNAEQIAELDFDLKADGPLCMMQEDDFDIDFTEPVTLAEMLSNEQNNNGNDNEIPSPPAAPLALGFLVPAFRRKEEDEYEPAAPAAVPSPQEPDYTPEQAGGAKILQFKREALADMVGLALAEDGEVIYDGSQSLLEEGTLRLRDGLLTSAQESWDATLEYVDKVLTEQPMSAIDSGWDTLFEQAAITLKNEQAAKADAEWDKVFHEADAVLAAEPKDAIDEVREMFAAAKGSTAKLYEQRPEAFVYDLYTQFGYGAEQINALAKTLGVKISVDNDNFQELMTKGGLHNIMQNVPVLTATEKEEVAADFREYGQPITVMAEIQNEIEKTAAESQMQSQPLYHDLNRELFVYDMMSNGADLTAINRAAALLDIEQVSKDQLDTLYKRGGMKRLSTILSEDEKQTIKTDLRQMVEEHNIEEFRNWFGSQLTTVSEEHKGDLAYVLVSQGNTFAEAAENLSWLGMDQQAVYDAFKSRVFSAEKAPKYTAEEKTEMLEGLAEIKAPYQLQEFLDEANSQALASTGSALKLDLMLPEEEHAPLFTVERLERVLEEQKAAAVVYNVQN